MRCGGSKRTRELGRDMLLAASIVKLSVPKAHMGEIALCRSRPGSSDPFSDLIFAKWGFNNVACIVVLFFFF